jgi:osmotically-inducible protein OsmY
MSGAAFARIDFDSAARLGCEPSVLAPVRAEASRDPAVSESELIEAVNLALCGLGYPRLRDLNIQMCDGLLVLRGWVSTYHQKQLAQATAQRVDGVREIANEVEVVCDRRGAWKSDAL